MKKQYFKNFLLLLGTLAVLFAMGELISRIWIRPPMMVQEENKGKDGNSKDNFTVRGMPDSLYQYTPTGGLRLTPNARILVKNNSVSQRDVEIATNSLGFRSPEFPPEKGGESRILVLGDSITLSDYVPEEETYTSRLESYLKKKNPSVRVINGGIGSSDIKNEYQTLLESGLKAKPDLVLVGLYLNDGELSANLIVKPPPGILKRSYFLSFLNLQIRSAWYRLEHRKELAGADREWVKKFIAGRTLSDKNWVNDPEGFDALIVKHVRDWGAAWDPKTWEVIRSYLVPMKKLAEENNFKLAVVLFPVRYQVEADYLYEGPQKYFLSLMEELNLPHRDLLPVLRESYQTHRSDLFYDKCHLTPEGNDLVGKAIAEFLLRSS